VKSLASHLPIKQVGLLDLVTVRLYADVRVLVRDPNNFSKGRVELVIEKVMKGVDGKNIIEKPVFERQRDRVAHLQTGFYSLMGIFDGVLGDVDPINLQARYSQRQFV
jgi:hypothetical protein